MCGIFCAINIDGFFDTTDYQIFIRQTDMVSYRGPDASGYKTFNVRESYVTSDGVFNVFLGHRRLSIIDISGTGNQPFTDDNYLWIIFNGEIFNYIELKEDLKKKGYTFKSNTDTEVILKVYREYGESGFDKLNGMWAFAIMDIPNKKMILSRDRFSIKPLYYTNIDNRLYFASEIKQILPFVKKREINECVMYKYMEQGLLNYNEETFYRNIYRLEPKCNLVIMLDSGKIMVNKYWDYSNGSEDVKLTFGEMSEKFRELFIDSVKIRLRSDVKVGSLLSGGLDSSTIAIVANNLQGGGFCTYSVVAKQKKYCEEKYIDILSKYPGIHNTKMLFELENNDIFINDIEKVIYYNDEPFGGFSAIAHYKILETLKENSDIKVVLSGQGGDEILMGYLKYFFFNIKNELKTGKYHNVFKQLVASFVKGTVVRQFRLSEARRYIQFLSNNFPKTFLKVKGSIEPLWEVNSLRERQILDIDRYSVPALTHYEDRNSMAHSLEIRLPFLDHRLVNCAVNLPVSAKLNGGWTKYILRKSIHELPNTIRWRKDKQGFIIPEDVWLKRDLLSLINKMFTKSKLEEMGIIDAKQFLDYYRSFQKGNSAIWFTDISRMFIAEMWAKKFFN